MKRLIGPAFDRNRIPLSSKYLEAVGLSEEFALGDTWNGAFSYYSPESPPNMLRVLASSGEGWDHVSVSLEHRCPTWGEMEWVKRLFFLENETAFQLHVPPSEHINKHPYTLHIWRPHHQQIPLPPSYMV